MLQDVAVYASIHKRVLQRIFLHWTTLIVCYLPRTLLSIIANRYRYDMIDKQARQKRSPYRIYADE